MFMNTVIFLYQTIVCDTYIFSIVLGHTLSWRMTSVSLSHAHSVGTTGYYYQSILLVIISRRSDRVNGTNKNWPTAIMTCDQKQWTYKHRHRRIEGGGLGCPNPPFLTGPPHFLKEYNFFIRGRFANQMPKKVWTTHFTNSESAFDCVLLPG